MQQYTQKVYLHKRHKLIMQKQTLIANWKKENIVTNQEVLKAFKKIKRENFILKEYKKYSYEDIPLPLGFGATISQPTTVVIMTQALEVEKGNKLLEIGTGSGYQAALLSVLVGEKGKVFTTEIVPELADFAQENLKEFKNVQVIKTDGSKGYEKEIPYDRIIYTVAVPRVHEFILNQLKDPGICLAPIGDQYSQELIKIRKANFQIKQQSLGYFQFVPLKGKYGF